MWFLLFLHEICINIKNWWLLCLEFQWNSLARLFVWCIFMIKLVFSPFNDIFLPLIVKWGIIFHKNSNGLSKMHQIVDIPNKNSNKILVSNDPTSLSRWLIQNGAADQRALFKVALSWETLVTKEFNEFVTDFSFDFRFKIN